MAPARGSVLIIPGALAVTALALALACGDDSNETTAMTETGGELPACSDVPADAGCQECTTASGNLSCAGAPSCALVDDECMQGYA